MRRATSITASRRVVKIQFEYYASNFNLSINDPTAIAGGLDIIFATCILPNYLREQGIGLSDS
jgi:hypothetical protein